MARRSQMLTVDYSNRFLHLQEPQEKISHQTLDHKVAFFQQRKSLMDDGMELSCLQFVAELYLDGSMIRLHGLAMWR